MKRGVTLVRKCFRVEYTYFISSGGRRGTNSCLRDNLHGEINGSTSCDRSRLFNFITQNSNVIGIIKVLKLSECLLS